MLVVQFQYEDEGQRQFCESKAREIVDLGRTSVARIAQMGQCLNQVRSTLPHGQWLPWLAAYFGWSEDTARRYMKVGGWYSQIPQIAEFGCVDLVLRFADLPTVSQNAVIEQEAYHRADSFERVAWEAAIREHMIDKKLDHDRRCGDALQAIQEGLRDPVLRETAERLYEENRETFARLSGREPAEVDAETGINTRPNPATGKVSAQFVQAEKYWICEWDGEKWDPVAPVQSYVLLWPGPSVVAAFPVPQDGPASVSWGAAAEDAVCRRLGAKSVAERFEVAL